MTEFEHQIPAITLKPLFVYWRGFKTKEMDTMNIWRNRFYFFLFKNFNSYIRWLSSILEFFFSPNYLSDVIVFLVWIEINVMLKRERSLSTNITHWLYNENSNRRYGKMIDKLKQVCADSDHKFLVFDILYILLTNRLLS